ncbi:MAG: RNA methyltransferase [Chloroflexi bacterium]|nr:RNA methyltransferase [Chloroflexota bacterium]
MITSTHNPKLKLIRALLGRAKERRETGAFVVEGVRLVEEAVNSNWKFRFALYDETLSERGTLNVERLTFSGIDVEEVSTSLMKSLSETESPQGILAVLEFTQLPVPNYCDFILIPDQIRDPGNLGTLLRTAAATGVQAVLLPPETTDAFAPKVVRSGMGAHFRLPIHLMSWAEINNFIDGSASHLTKQNDSSREDSARLSEKSHLSGATHPPIQVFLADMDGQSCWETDLRQPLALIIGSEADGASESARKLANAKISIPMSGNMESLNAGVAGSVLMFEVVRQRIFK